MEKIEDGSGEPALTIRASLKKLDFDKDVELVIFLARKRKNHVLSRHDNAGV